MDPQNAQALYMLLKSSRSKGGHMSIQTRKKESRLRTEEGVSTALPPKPRQSQIEESGIRSKKDMVRKSNHFEGELMEEPVSFMPQQPQHAVEEPKVEFNRSEN